jgi:hypothetical protein
VPAPKPVARTSAHLHAATERADARVTRAQAIAFAHAVNLTAADVPGATASANTERPEREAVRCGTLGREHEVADVKSLKLTRGNGLETEEISSDVTVRTSARLAARNVQATRNASVRACVARVLRRRLARRGFRGVHLGELQLSYLPVSASGSDVSGGIRAVMALSSPQRAISVPIYVDALAFTRGPAEISVVAVSATQPVPETTEHQLVELLASRASAHRV